MLYGRDVVVEVVTKLGNLRVSTVNNCKVGGMLELSFALSLYNSDAFADSSSPVFQNTAKSGLMRL